MDFPYRERPVQASKCLKQASLILAFCHRPQYSENGLILTCASEKNIIGKSSPYTERQPLKQFLISPEALSVAILLARILRPSKAFLSNTWGFLIRCFWYLFFKIFSKYTREVSYFLLPQKALKILATGKNKAASSLPNTLKIFTSAKGLNP